MQADSHPLNKVIQGKKKLSSFNGTERNFIGLLIVCGFITAVYWTKLNEFNSISRLSFYINTTYPKVALFFFFTSVFVLVQCGRLLILDIFVVPFLCFLLFNTGQFTEWVSDLTRVLPVHWIVAWGDCRTFLLKCWSNKTALKGPSLRSSEPLSLCGRELSPRRSHFRVQMCNISASVETSFFKSLSLD